MCNQYEQGTSVTVRNDNDKFERINLFFDEREYRSFFYFHNSLWGFYTNYNRDNSHKTITNYGITKEIIEAIMLIAINSQISIYCPITTGLAGSFKEWEKIQLPKMTSISVETNAEISKTIK